MHITRITLVVFSSFGLKLCVHRVVKMEGPVSDLECVLVVVDGLEADVKRVSLVVNCTSTYIQVLKETYHNTLPQLHVCSHLVKVEEHTSLALHWFLFSSFGLKLCVHLVVKMEGPVSDLECVLVVVDGLEADVKRVSLVVNCTSTYIQVLKETYHNTLPQLHVCSHLVKVEEHTSLALHWFLFSSFGLKLCVHLVVKMEGPVSDLECVLVVVDGLGIDVKHVSLQ